MLTKVSEDIPTSDFFLLKQYPKTLSTKFQRNEIENEYLTETAHLDLQLTQ